jgi:hypothetical protein
VPRTQIYAATLPVEPEGGCAGPPILGSPFVRSDSTKLLTGSVGLLTSSSTGETRCLMGLSDATKQESPQNLSGSWPTSWTWA